MTVTERMMSLDLQVANLIELATTTLSGPSEPTPQDRRELANLVAPLFRGTVDESEFIPMTVSDDDVVSADGATIRLRTYRPVQQEVAGTILYMHGGGWVAGSVESYDPELRRLVTKTGMSVAAVEYRLSPEYRRPAASEDCLAAAHALLARSNGSALAIAGDSAGGHLALECAVALREEGVDLAALLLFYPVVDPAAFANHSYQENGRDYLLTADDMLFYWTSYLGTNSTAEFVDESPFSAERVRGLPPTVLVTAGFDPLRDEGRELAAVLAQADVTLAYLPNPTLTHGFQQMVPRVDAAKVAVDAALTSFRFFIER
jgi:acetyl esterase